MTLHNQSVEAKYYNLFGHGHAYVRRIREVRPKRAEPFIACDLFALDRGQTRRIDVKVVGREAEEKILQIRPEVEKGVQIGVEFRASDLYVDPYEDKNQPGQFKTSVKGRLLLVPWIGEGEIKNPDDIEFNGLAYLNHVYTTRTDFLKASLSALHGAADGVEYTPFDCVVDGRIEAMMRTLQTEVEAQKRVLIGFKSRGMVPRVFIFEKGEKQGQPGGSIGSTLQEISWAKVNGVAVPLAEARDESQPAATPDHVPTVVQVNNLAALI